MEKAGTSEGPSGGVDLFDVGPLVARWSATYDIVVRSKPDIALRSDSARSTSDAFRDEFEVILDRRLVSLVAPGYLVELNASDIDDRFDGWPLAKRLAGLV